MAEFSDARERWDRRYAEGDGFLFGKAPNRWLVANAGWVTPAARILCVADGEGRNGVWLAQHGHRVTTFDISAVGVERARELAAENRVALEQSIADVADWAWQPECHDAVVAIFIQFAPPPLRAKIFDGIRRTLKPGGVLILEGYGQRQTPPRTGGPGVPEQLYSTPLLLRAFDGWAVLASRDVDAELAEGAAHKGNSHLVSMVLRKPAH